ncbi:MAG: DUF1822 family protein [Cyanosarcina radialis HA8281-LM2]|nr:DUF1822 family protein [Cyanosarcina radialis HA8281-LM2]
MRKPYPAPQPGEIWELTHQIRYPGEFYSSEQNKLYSTEAQNFLQGNAPPRYVTIVTEPEVESETGSASEIVSVMVLSAETNFISDVDLLIPAHISGLGRDLLAETWHVQPMLIDNLLHPVGQRLSRDIYDILLTVGDYYHELVDRQPEINDIERLGLKSGRKKAASISEINRFHERERAWSDVLTIPVAVDRAYIKSLEFTSQLLHERLEIERELAEIDFSKNRSIDSLSISLNQTRTILSRWWQNIFEPEWQAVSTLPKLAIATRSSDLSLNTQLNSEEMAATIGQLLSTNDETQRQRAAKQLGEVTVGNSNAIQALVSLLRSTSDDETLWMAVESLRKIDPENPAAGVKRVKLIDLGMEVAGKTVALAVAFLPKNDGDVSVLLQVYPTGNDDRLPPDLKLILLDEPGEICREVVARRADVYLQLKFSCQIGEKFSVQLALGDANFNEDFAV